MSTHYHYAIFIGPELHNDVVENNDLVTNLENNEESAVKIFLIYHI